MNILPLLAVAILGMSGRAQAYTLEVTSCNTTNSGFPNDEEQTVTFRFCDGGSYCDADSTEPLPPGIVVSSNAGTIQINVDTGFEPTTAVFERGEDAFDAWCIADVRWEDGDNLLGEDALLELDGQTGEEGCESGVSDTTLGVATCKSSWRFFNIDGADYKYDVQVEACAGTSSASVLAYFCSNAACDGGEMGEEVPFTLTMSDEDGGVTTESIELPFNPLAVRLEEVDDTWCAEALTFNRFPLFSGSLDVSDFEDGGSMIYPNIQQNGELILSTPAPSPDDDDGDSEEDAWLDAAWEVAVTVIGSIIVAAGAACGSFIWERNRSQRRRSEASTMWPCRPVTRNGPINLPGKSVGEFGLTNGHRQEEDQPHWQQQGQQPPFL